MNKAAADVASNGARDTAAARVAISDEARTLAANGKVADSTPQGASDLAGALIESTIAQHEQAANIAVLKTDDEMQRELIALGQRR